MKKTWGVISETLNRKVKNSTPETITIKGEDCSNREIVVENFNTFLLVLEKRMNTTFTHIKGHTLTII